MPKLTAREVKALAKSFFSVARALTDFREARWDTLTKSQHQQLSRLQWSIYNNTDDLLALSSAMALDEVQKTLTQIGRLAQQAQEAIKRTEDVSLVLGITTQVIRLGGAVVSQSPLAIIVALADLAEVTQRA